jgi:hypothetical protein
MSSKATESRPRRRSTLQGEIALMLCESILHVLVEKGVITKAAAIDAIETVGDAMREMAQDIPTSANRTAADSVTEIAQSFMLKGVPTKPRTASGAGSASGRGNGQQPRSRRPQAGSGSCS